MGKISGDEIEDDLDLSSCCGDTGELFQDDLSQSKKQAQKEEIPVTIWNLVMLSCSLSNDCTEKSLDVEDTLFVRQARGLS